MFNDKFVGYMMEASAMVGVSESYGVTIMIQQG
jgi:hypothetical protein